MYKYLADSNVDWGQNKNYLGEYKKRHRGERISVNPDGPAKGIVIVNVNRLSGLNYGPDEYKWLRENYEPIDHIGYSWLVYRVP